MYAISQPHPLPSTPRHPHYATTGSVGPPRMCHVAPTALFCLDGTRHWRIGQWSQCHCNTWVHCCVRCCERCGWCGQSSSCRGDPVGPKGCDHVVLRLLGATSGAHQGQMTVCGQQGAGGCSTALLALAASMGDRTCPRATLPPITG